ncbi:CsbA family protein [Rossellomorea aquimaris]|uniref:CsbA family protein n=1 Tax=Rossellomorea aquimaris TaxID=189382 RepID=UPI001CD61528|nr:CsbA family protein [Rossellomorea aquimaris]MCA1055356.1 CsbA family protein [Rossellomorea aquimaris]
MGIRFIGGESNVSKFILGIFLPGLLVILFTRVTYNHIVGLILTVALIAASVSKGYTDSWWLIVVDAASLTVGFWYSNQMMNKAKKKA